MKIPASISLALSTFHLTATYNPEVLDNVLSTLQYLVNVHAGVFSCVFYDANLEYPFDYSILEAILKSSQLDHRITKYVVNRTYHEGLEMLPREPSVLLISFGNSNDSYEEHSDFLKLFNPTTKVLVFVDHRVESLLYGAMYKIGKMQFAYSVFIDDLTMAEAHCNGIHCGFWPKMPQPIYQFELGRRWFAGKKVLYIGDNCYGFYWNHVWLNETARYLNTEAFEIQHNCTGIGPLLIQCLLKLTGHFDIIFHPSWILADLQRRGFHTLLTNVPLSMKIAIPRDRPLNVAELLLMPFSWQVWIILILIIAMSEVFKHSFPQYFRNDPFLLTVCGFERHNLHQASRWEKIIFLALIILMFFMTNAFETKIVSLMTSKPSIQRIKTLSDLLRSNIKFRFDIENNPYFADNLVVGKLVIQGETPKLHESIPGIGVITYSDQVDIYHDSSFDLDRMQPFYVVLDHYFLEGPEAYTTGWRSLLIQPFRLIHDILLEAGILTYMKRNWKENMSSSGKRKPNQNTCGQNYLIFEDMQPAWAVLAIGLSLSLAGFLGELIKKRMNLGKG